MLSHDRLPSSGRRGSAGGIRHTGTPPAPATDASALSWAAHKPVSTGPSLVKIRTRPVPVSALVQ